MQTETRQKYKLVFLGNSFVGKTSIIERFVYDQFDPKQQTTVGIDFIGKTLQNHEGKQIRLLLWDTAGQERFHSLIPSYLRDANCAVIVFDVTSRHSFENVEKWYKEVKSARGNEALIVVFGNKIDCQREVTEDEGRDYANKKDILYFEVSAKNGSGINEAMEALCLALPTEPSVLVTQSQLNQSQFEQTVASNRKPIHLESNGINPKPQQPQSSKSNSCCTQ